MTPRRRACVRVKRSGDRTDASDVVGEERTQESVLGEDSRGRMK